MGFTDQDRVPQSHETPITLVNGSKGRNRMDILRAEALRDSEEIPKTALNDSPRQTPQDREVMPSCLNRLIHIIIF